MKDYFVCSDTCLSCDDRCCSYGCCYICKCLDSDFCLNCYYYFEEHNCDFYEVRKNYDL